MGLSAEIRRPTLLVGFTLVELLMAGAIFILLLAGVTSLLVSSLRAYEVSERVTSRVQDVEAAVRVMRADVEIAGYVGVDEVAIEDGLRDFSGEPTIVIYRSADEDAADSLEVRFFEDRLYGAPDRCGGVCAVRYEIGVVDGSRVLVRIEGTGLSADQQGILRDMNNFKVLGFLNRAGATIQMVSGSYVGTLSAINIQLTLADGSTWVFPIAVPNAQLVSVIEAADGSQ